MRVYILFDQYGPISVHKTYEGVEKAYKHWRVTKPELKITYTIKTISED